MTMQKQEILSSLLFTAQAIFVAFFLSSTNYSDSGFQFDQYGIFRDIMAMLLLGFGYLMTFMKSYGLGAVGFTMILTVVALQANVAVEYAMRAIYTQSEPWPMPLTVYKLIDAEFYAATMLITFGALIGRASPLQMLVLTLLEAVFYAFNKVILVLGYIGAEDVGGTMTIHMFGAFFGLAASFALGAPGDDEHLGEDKISDIFSLVGTTILWVFWPSFVGATETGHLELESRCVIHTVLALSASTLAAFWTSHRLTNGKFDPVHIANSTLAGGVAVGCSARLEIGPGGAILLGAVAGIISVTGFVHSTPFLQSRLSLYDTCGVANLHGYPSILGGLASMIFVAMDSSAEFLLHETRSQVLRQLGAVVATLFVSIVTGFATGKVLALLKDEEKANYRDVSWWATQYFDASHHAKSVDVCADPTIYCRALDPSVTQDSLPFTNAPQKNKVDVDEMQA